MQISAHGYVKYYIRGNTIFYRFWRCEVRGYSILCACWFVYVYSAYMVVIRERILPTGLFTCLVSQWGLGMGAYNSFAMHSYTVYISRVWMRLKKPRSSTRLNRDRTLHTNGTIRVLQVSKTLDLFFGNKSIKTSTEASIPPPAQLSLAYMHCKDDVQSKLFP